MQKSFLIAVGLGAALAQASPAPAQSADQVVSTRISYADLDLSTRHGVATLDRRIGAAINRLCRTGPNPGAITYFQREDCRIGARASIGSQRAFAIAAARRGDNGVQVARLGR
jgi:UrcA family protein